jgi:crotonobetainyl-CoA:carnitine CoA-transferase CaiB-like acyl-CoA transferase
MLADYGADVVWIEPPGGDPCRTHDPAAISVFNRGKRSVVVDLKISGDRERVLELADRAEVFVETWAPGTAERLGLGYDVLHARKPDLLYLSISGFGEDGRDANQPGYEAIVQALTGGMAEQPGHREGPIYVGWPFATLGAAYLGVIGVLASLYRRDQDGAGRHISTSLVDGALAYHSMMWGESDESVAVAEQHGGLQAHQRVGTTRHLSRAFECSDGEFFGMNSGALGAFGRAVRVLGLDDRIPVTTESGLDLGVPITSEQQAIILNEVPEIMRTKPRDEWVKLFLEADVGVAEILRPTEAFDTPQIIHNEMIVEVDDPVLGGIQQVGIGAKLSRTPGEVRGPAPVVGQHTEAVWADAAGWPLPERARTAHTLNTKPLLDGVRIVDFGAYIAGPYTSRLLADLGADVIKVEPVYGDPVRGVERCFYTANANKRALAMDLKDPELAKAIERLLQRADVVTHNQRPGAAERLGLGYDQVCQVNPATVYLYAPGWGSSGPAARRQSFAPLVSGFVGVAFESGGRFNAPMSPIGNEDPGNALLGAMGVMLALVERLRSGEGQYVENPQLNSAMGHVAHVVRSLDGTVIGAGRLDPVQLGFGPFERLYKTADGWVTVVAYAEIEQAALLSALGVKRIDDPDTQADIITSAMGEQKTAEVLAHLQAVGVAAAEPVGRNMHNLMNDLEQRRTGRVIELPHPTKGNIREIDVLLRVTGSERVAHRLAPEVGEHSTEILLELGYSPQEIDALRDRKAVR